MKYSSNGLVKLLMFLSIAGFVILAFVLTTVFTNAFSKNLNNSLSNIRINYNKNSKIEAEDKIQKLIDFINIYKKTLNKRAKDRVKDNVDFATNIINDTYKQYKNSSKEIIYQKIREQLKNIRFFNDKSGYFFIYNLQGKCILLPTNPKLQGKNLLNLKDGNGDFIIRRLINFIKFKQEGFLEWSWHKIGEKQMKKKLGFIKLYKPLGIIVGTARYKEDITNTITEDARRYLKSLNRDDYGYIFAYDFSGNSMLESDKYKNINRWNDIIQGNHIVRDAIKGAQIIPDGFFMKYRSKNNQDKFSYVKLIPDFDWIIGTTVKNIEPIYKKEKHFLQQSMSKMIKDFVLISIVIVVVFILIFLLISFKIQKLFSGLENSVKDKTKELTEQKNVFKKLFDSASSGIALSKNKKIFNCNSATLKLFDAQNKDEFLSLETRDCFPDKQDNGIDSMIFLEHKLDIGREKGSVDFDIQAKTIKGRKIWLNIVATKIILQNKDAGYFVFRDITSRKKTESDLQAQQEKLQFQAKHDSLTSLPNRLFFMDRLYQSIKRAQRNKKYLIVAFLDIDNFKMINDAFGHDVGDLLLIEIASILRGFTRITDTISRFGGDEFVLVLDNLNSADDSLTIIQKIANRFQEPFFIDNNPYDITFSVGISVYPNDAVDEHSLLKYADMAMYRAKNSGKNRYVYFDESMNTDILKHIKIEQDIRKGIKNDEFVLHYQPQFEVGTQKIVGFEALVRWQHPTLGLKYPDYFIQIAENSNLMVPLGEAISQKAMSQISLWYSKGLNPGIMSINFTAKQLQSDNFFLNLEKLLKITKCKPEWIEAEMIERHIMRDTEKTTNILKRFKDIGIQVAIDDFGTGYSSLSYLKYLEISKLKIDKAFVDDLAKDKRDRAIVKSIIDISLGLDLEVLAEGVETKEQYEVLSELGCHTIQGYYFSRPVASDEAQKLLLKKS